MHKFSNLFDKVLYILIPVERDFPPVQTGPEAHPASFTMGTESFPGVKYGRGVLLTTHPLLVPRSWKSTAIPLPTLWATTGPVRGTLYLYSTFFGQVHCPSSGIFQHCIHATGICHINSVGSPLVSRQPTELA